jgi:hypothetical protein
LRTYGAFSATIYPNFTSVFIPKAILAVIAFCAFRTTTIYLFLPVIEHAVIAVWWNFITFIEAAGHKKTGRKYCHKYNNVGTKSHSKNGLSGFEDINTSPLAPNFGCIGFLLQPFP